MGSREEPGQGSTRVASSADSSSQEDGAVAITMAVSHAHQMHRMMRSQCQTLNYLHAARPGAGETRQAKRRRAAFPQQEQGAPKQNHH